MANVEFKGGTYRLTRAGLHATLTQMDCEMRDAILQLPYGTKRDQYNTDALEERYMAQSEYLRAAIDALPLED
jgi:hypothetical protein